MLRLLLLPNAYPPSASVVHNRSLTVHTSKLLLLAGHAHPASRRLPQAHLLLQGGRQAAARAPRSTPEPDVPAAGFVARSIDQMEQDLILDTLVYTKGNRTHAATILGISIRALRNKLRDYANNGIAVPAPMSPGGV